MKTLGWKENICHALTIGAVTSSCQAKFWSSVMVHLGTTAYNLHMAWRTALFVLPFHLTWLHSRELLVDVVLGFMDVVLDGNVNARLHVSQYLHAAVGLRWYHLVYCHRIVPRLFGLALRLSRSCLSMPPGNLCHAGGWHLRRKPCVEASLRPLFPCGIIASLFCVLVACTTHSF